MLAEGLRLVLNEGMREEAEDFTLVVENFLVEALALDGVDLLEAEDLDGVVLALVEAVDFLVVVVDFFAVEDEVVLEGDFFADVRAMCVSFGG